MQFLNDTNTQLSQTDFFTWGQAGVNSFYALINEII